MHEIQGSPPTEIVAAASPSTTLSPLAQAALDAGMPAATRRKYKRCWDLFCTWCEQTGREPLPATTDTITEFVTHLAYRYQTADGQLGLSPASIHQARWAIAKAHEAAGLPPLQMKPSLQVIKGYQAHLARSKDPRSRPSKATAATKDDVRRLAEASDPGRLIGLRNRAMVLLHYSAATRISELVGLDIADITMSDQGYLVHVYRAKTRRQNDPVVPARHAPLAVRAMKEWLAALEAAGRTSGAIFPRIDRHGKIAPPLRHNGKAADERLTPDGANRILKRMAAELGLEGKRSSHAYRRGFATEARRAGHDNVRIAAQGGWDPASPVLFGYMEDADKWEDNPLKGAGV